jgi:hypothetical protein
MSETNKQLQEFILTSLKESKDFVIDQAPEVVQQVLNMAIFDSIVFSVSCFLVSLALLMVCKWSIKKSKEEYSADEWLFLTAITAVFGILSIVPAFVHCMDAISIYLYPKAYLLRVIL